MVSVLRYATLHDLPDELLIEILGHRLLTPLDVFFDEEFDKHMRSARDRRETGQCPDYVLLLVCKQWRTLAEPMLYSRLMLVSVQDVRQVAAFLKRKPTIGSKVRYLRLHGGFGAELVGIAERTSCVEAVYLSSQEVYSSVDAIGSLERALYTLAPSMIFIGFMNKSFSSMTDSYDAMMYFLQYSDSLKYVHFAKFVHFTESLEDALVSSPTVETISFHSNLLSMIAIPGNLLERLAAEGRVRRVICRDSAHRRDRFEQRYPKELLRMLSFE
ncbi:hypothetical protein PHLGIDRAFT_283188 [Phlebiopsis gigantea 11061_1 CR5-6]|uniref:Uncharacterized protein n=1 Tax=Phlebiopsis gigantea (strain 11061_1 CR5-6) TaxID=745531 RepID=A0A0C3PCA5_PHLG1|nr:hypothetical protein PHLGIDRAFT_283188 [Phlebiopsis gigantea 11061_1 CR5-6]